MKYTKDQMIDITNHYYDRDYDYIKNNYGISRGGCGSNIDSWSKKYDYIKKIKDLRCRYGDKYSIQDMIDFTEHYISGDYEYIKNKYRVNSTGVMRKNIYKWSKEHNSIAVLIKNADVFKKKAPPKKKDKFSEEQRFDMIFHYYDGDHEYNKKVYGLDPGNVRANISFWSKRYDDVREIKELRGRSTNTYTEEERIDITLHYYDGDHDYNKEKYNIRSTTVVKHIKYWADRYDYIKEIKDLKCKVSNTYTEENMIDIANHYYDKDYKYLYDRYGINNKLCVRYIIDWAKKYDSIKKIKDLRCKVYNNYCKEDILDIIDHFYDKDYIYLKDKYGITNRNTCDGVIRRWSEIDDDVREAKNLRCKTPNKFYSKEDMLDITNHYYDRDYTYIKDKYGITSGTTNSHINAWSEIDDDIKYIKNHRSMMLNRYSKENMIDIANHYYDKDYMYIEEVYGINTSTCATNIYWWAKRDPDIKRIKDLRSKQSRLKYTIDDMIDFTNHYLSKDYEYISKNYRVKAINTMKNNIRNWSRQHETIASLVDTAKKKNKIKKKKQPKPVKYTDVNSYPLKSCEEESEDVRAWR